MPRRPTDPSTSLERKLRDFGSSLPDEERELFNDILAMAAGAAGAEVTEVEGPEVEGFGHRYAGSAFDSLSDMSSMESMRMQQLMERRAKSLEMLTNLMGGMSRVQDIITARQK